MEELIENSFPQLSNKEVNQYRVQAIPSELDDNISQLIDTFKQASPSQRELIMGGITQRNLGVLFAYCERMASLGVREQSLQRLLEGLLALVIVDFKRDWRDSLGRFSLFHDAALKIGIEPERIFAVAASYASREMGEQLVNFVQRSPEMKSIKAMGFKEADAPDGFRYVIGR
jgi:hypothetical protein